MKIEKIQKHVLNGRECSILALCAQIVAHDYEEMHISEIDKYINLLDGVPKEIAKAIFDRKTDKSTKRCGDSFVSWAVGMAKHGKCFCKKCKANFNR